MKLLTPFVAEPIARPTAATIETEEQIIAKKEQFAELLLRESEPFKIGLILYPNDTGRALQVAHEWPNDPQVKAFQQSAIDSEGEITFLPSKADLARALWSLANRDDIHPEVRDSKVKALRTYADVRGFVEKPAVSVQNNVQNNLTHNVMVVRVHGTDDEWENKLRRQQQRLKGEVYEVAANVSAT